MTRKLTLVAVGDQSSEKTQLLIEYTYTSPYKEYMPKTFVNNIQDLVVDSVPYSVYFIDAESNDDYKILRKDFYSQADCILLCYSMYDRNSYRNLKKKWIIEIRTVVSMHTPILIVATGAESRNNLRREVSSEEGVKLRYLVGAVAYVECSVKTCTGIDNVFIEAVRSTYMDGTWSKRRQCWL